MTLTLYHEGMSSHPEIAQETVLATASPPAFTEESRHGHPSMRIRAALVRVLTVTASLWLFICALTVMKTGAKALAPMLHGSALTDSLPSTLGFGWLSAMLVMSGSPIATSALALLDGDAIGRDQAFMMLSGSRLGAAFVVLAVAFLYAIRGRSSGEGRRASLSIGIFSLVLTAVVYVPAMSIGLPVLHSGALDRVPLAPPPAMLDVVDAATRPVLTAITGLAPEVAVFFIGLALLLVAIRILDSAIPGGAAGGETSVVDEHSGWRSRPWLMFALGSVVAFVTMSVAVALTMLVPLVARGHLRRRHTIPYIMGANISTLGDTLLTAFVLGNEDAVHVVVAELCGIVLITVGLLVFLYRPLTEALVGFTDWMLDRKLRTGAFVALLFAAPLALIHAVT